MVFPLYYNVKIEGRMYWLPSIKWKSINKLTNARIVIKNACLVSVYSPEEDAPLWAPPDTCRKKNLLTAFSIILVPNIWVEVQVHVGGRGHRATHREADCSPPCALTRLFMPENNGASVGEQASLSCFLSVHSPSPGTLIGPRLTFQSPNTQTHTH